MVDQDLAAYLAGDDTAPVTAEQRLHLDTIRAVLADPAVWAEPDPRLADSIVAAVTAESRPTFAPGTAGASTGLGNARRTRSIAHLLLGVAAAIIIAAGVTVGLIQHPTAPAPTFAAELTGTPLAASASGEATLTRTPGGWQIQLRASGLPRRDSGNYYEAWLKNGAGVLVPVGTFNEPSQVTLWAGVSPADYPTLTITEQQANGNPASSGRVVLTGTTHR
jgi:hypothetical protein